MSFMLGFSFLGRVNSSIGIKIDNLREIIIFKIRFMKVLYDLSV